MHVLRALLLVSLCFLSVLAAGESRFYTRNSTLAEEEAVMESMEEEEVEEMPTLTFSEYVETNPIVFEDDVQRTCQDVSYDFRWFFDQMTEGKESLQTRKWEQTHQECSKQMHNYLETVLKNQVSNFCVNLEPESKKTDALPTTILTACNWKVAKNQTYLDERRRVLFKPMNQATSLLRRIRNNSTLVGFNENEFMKLHPNEIVVDHWYENFHCGSDLKINATACIHTVPTGKVFKNFEGRQISFANTTYDRQLYKRETANPPTVVHTKLSISHIHLQALIVFAVKFGPLVTNGRHKFLIETTDSLNFLDGSKCRPLKKYQQLADETHENEIACSPAFCPVIRCSKDAIVRRVEWKAERDCRLSESSSGVFGLLCSDANKTMEFGMAAQITPDEPVHHFFAADQLAAMVRLPYRKMTPDFFFGDEEQKSSAASVAPVVSEPDDSLAASSILLLVIAVLLLGILIVNTVFVVRRLVARKTAGVDGDDRVQFVRFSQDNGIHFGDGH